MSAELNKIVVATMPVNPYDDRTVVAAWKWGFRHRTGIVNASEGKYNLGINPLCTGNPLKGTLTKFKTQMKMPHNAAFHHGLHCLLT